MREETQAKDLKRVLYALIQVDGPTDSARLESLMGELTEYLMETHEQTKGDPYAVMLWRLLPLRPDEIDWDSEPDPLFVMGDITGMKLEQDGTLHVESEDDGFAQDAGDYTDGAIENCIAWLETKVWMEARPDHLEPHESKWIADTKAICNGCYEYKMCAPVGDNHRMLCEECFKERQEEASRRAYL